MQQQQFWEKIEIIFVYMFKHLYNFLYKTKLLNQDAHNHMWWHLGHNAQAHSHTDTENQDTQTHRWQREKERERQQKNTK